MVQRLSVFGSTGSIGESTLDVVAFANAEAAAPVFEVDTLVAHRNVERLAEQARTFRPRHLVIADETLMEPLKARVADLDLTVSGGRQGVLDAADRPVDVVMAAMVGAAGLEPTLRAIEAGADIALANKETMVCAGPLVKAAARKARVTLRPVDSEHNAIFQVLQNPADVERYILTASGGPFRTAVLEEMRDASIERALAHPRWSMGDKISLDSATMMNKALEVIETGYLFNVQSDRIDVVVHPQSIVHSLVSYKDGSVLAQMGEPDMRTPIAHALGYPDRIATRVKRLDLTAIGRLDFEPLDHDRFPAVGLARQALAIGWQATAVFNAANEIAGEHFLRGEIGFLDIADLVRRVSEDAAKNAWFSGASQLPALEEVLEVDKVARDMTRALAGVSRREPTNGLQ